VGPTDPESDGVFARYVSLGDLEGCGFMLRHGSHKGTDLTRTSSVGHAPSIRLPYTDGTQMTLGFRGSHQEAPVSAVKYLPLCLCIFTEQRATQLSLGKDMYTFWRLRPVAIRHEKVVWNRLITANETIVEGGGVKKTLIKTVTTTTRTVTRVVPGDV